MAQRIIKACSKCNYELTEQVNTNESRAVVKECTCPQCGGKAKHFMFIDKSNLPDPAELFESNKRHSEVCHAIEK